ncbi:MULTISPECIES: hypothetical protein [Eubacteriales]|uniref:Uncharacterized protein n=1 Tax=Bittarella massiliensis (ex Durand et al. 2017) TaxID=1720313 RepID=A0AAQ1MEL8_9FIRM|nr:MULTISPECIES: hypothetical protein [Eubacteriales]MZL70447.1 hypothetical protein [Bittarella massiliensis (ex Durand et al. 2017)]MZL80320.1 hypothetical protein [Bittarella massiliensis (ex Durand et al. 2017)]SHG33701.1 hypothetical protein SAMN05444424_2157 [Bittarella massiliensis (ex Durand et al. 2017)]
MERHFVRRPYGPADGTLRRKTPRAVIGRMTAAGKDLLTRWKLFAPSDEVAQALDVAAPRGPAVNRGISYARRTNGPCGRDFPAGRFKARRCG